MVFWGDKQKKTMSVQKGEGVSKISKIPATWFMNAPITICIVHNHILYFQYPFILSIVAKRHILTKDSEQQMILTARRSLVQKMARNQAPKIEIFFLNISVRRANVSIRF